MYIFQTHATTEVGTGDLKKQIPGLRTEFSNGQDLPGGRFMFGHGEGSKLPRKQVLPLSPLFQPISHTHTHPEIEENKEASN